MLSKFKSYIEDNKLFDKTEKVLLAVSGGKDSMTMIHLFQSNKLLFGIAHVNFQIRGDDANEDEQFLKEFAKKNKISFYTVVFDTQKYAIKKGISIQMGIRLGRTMTNHKSSSQKNLFVNG